jgi:5-methylcytosine-specific restriction protein B
MNPLDRSVDELDAAFERRFAKVSMEPNIEALERMLRDNGASDVLVNRVLIFLSLSAAKAYPGNSIGHA